MENDNRPVNEANGKSGASNKNGYYKKRKKKFYNNKPNQEKSSENAPAEKKESPSAQAPKQSSNPAKAHHRKKNRHRGGAPKANEDINTSAELAVTEKNLSDTVSDSEPDLSFYSTPVLEEQPVEEPAEEVKKVEIIGIRFKAGGKTYYFDPNGLTAKRGAHAIVETARGQEFGEVALPNSMVPETDIVPPLRPVVRIATEADAKHHAENKAKEDEAFKICNEKIIAHKLDMKLIDAQYTFDNSKLLFYFTSSGRVDFRELVKDLAAVFKTRIELRQIGIRDEAKLIGGLGMCGRPICCSVFLADFGQVSIKMAKEQNLSLNSAKISGVCGRLMCCLRYEYDTYVKEIKNSPPVDSKVKTPDGIGVVTEINPLAQKVKVRLDEKPDVQPKAYARDSVAIIPNKKD